MSRPAPSRFDGGPRQRASLTLAEAVISIVIVGTMLVGALSTVGAAAKLRQRLAERARGQLLADALMTEILEQVYLDPQSQAAGQVTFGLEPGESSASRAAFDDVDDYDGWSAAPPQESDGSVIPDLDGWRRSVTVRRVAATDLETTSPTETGVKRIEVTVSASDVPVATVVAVRTRAMDEQMPGAP